MDDELQRVMMTAARCADCENAACMKACPEQVDLRALFKFIAAQSPVPVAWMRDTRAAVDFVTEAIEQSFA